MNKEFFKPEDFLDTKGVYIYPAHTLANIANKKLQELIESWPVVYGQKGNSLEGFQSWEMSDSTHRARLAFIEPIVKEPCKHEASYDKLKTIFSVDRFGKRYAHGTSVCINCDAILEAKWEEKK